jgi:hypothetical protein
VTGATDHRHSELNRRRWLVNVQDYCAREGARVFAAIYRAIKEHTLVLDEVAERMATESANAHTDVVAGLLRGRGRTDHPKGSRAGNDRRREVAIDGQGV